MCTNSEENIAPIQSSKLRWCKRTEQKKEKKIMPFLHKTARNHTHHLFFVTCMYHFLKRFHTLSGDIGKLEQCNLENMWLLDSLGDYCRSIFYDYSLDRGTIPLTTRWASGMSDHTGLPQAAICVLSVWETGSMKRRTAEGPWDQIRVEILPKKKADTPFMMNLWKPLTWLSPTRRKGQS